MEESQTQTQPTRLRFVDMLVGVFISPSDTLPQIAQQRPMGAALGFIIALYIIGYVLEIVLPEKRTVGLGITAQEEFSIMKMMLNTAHNLISFIVFVALVHGFIRFFKDGGSYRGTFCALAFARAPAIVLDLLNILASFSYQPLWPWPSALENFSNTDIFGILLAILIVIWMATLGVIAIRAHYGISAIGAIIAYILAGIVDGVIMGTIRKVFEFF